MTKCIICNINEANQTGAHIFPAWMIASAFDEKERNRDYEVIHNFYAVDNNLPFFGRSVQLEKIEENIGRELNDEEIKSQKNPLVVDNLWCRECENKFKIVEDYFLENVDKKTLDFSDCNSLDIVQLKLNIYLVRLFLYSLIYRASITEKLGFKLEIKIEERLKYFISNYLQTDLKNTLNYLNHSKRKNELLAYPIRCIKTENEKGKTSKPVYVHDKYDKPFCFLINNYILQFYTKESHLRSTPSTFWGISDIILKMDNTVNLDETEFRLVRFNLSVWGVIKDNFIKYHSCEKIKKWRIMYKEIIKGKFGDYPSEAQTQKFITILAQNDKKIGIKYTDKEIVDAMNKSLK